MRDYSGNDVEGQKSSQGGMKRKQTLLTNITLNQIGSIVINKFNVYGLCF
jgi:hypothetical protein